MTENTKRLLENGSHPMGTWLSIGHPAVAEVNASPEIDFILVDTEHTTIPLKTVENLDRAISGTASPTDTIVRVPWNDHVHLKRVLDIGVDGVMVPMIDSADEARKLVDAMRYPPDGSRGIASGRAAGYGSTLTDYVQNASDSLVTVAQIETIEGLSNVDEIAAVNGIDALFVGPADMAGALGVFGEENPSELVQAMERVIEAAGTAGVAAGTLAVSTNDIAELIGYGFDFLIVGKDTSTLADANQKARAVYDEVTSACHKSHSR